MNLDKDVNFYMFIIKIAYSCYKWGLQLGYRKCTTRNFRKDRNQENAKAALRKKWRKVSSQTKV